MEEYLERFEMVIRDGEINMNGLLRRWMHMR